MIFQTCKPDDVTLLFKAIQWLLALESNPNSSCGHSWLFWSLFESFYICVTVFRLHWSSFQFPEHSEYRLFSPPGKVFTALPVWLVNFFPL